MWMYSHAPLNDWDICSEKYIIRQFFHLNIIECTYTILEDIAYYMPQLHGIPSWCMQSLIDQNVIILQLMTACVYICNGLLA